MQRAENSLYQRILLAHVSGDVVASCERNELGGRYLGGRTPRLLQEVGISSSDKDQASDSPRSKVLGDSALSQTLRPCRLQSRRIVVEEASAQRLRKTDLPKRLHRLNESLHALHLSLNQPVRQNASKGAIGPAVRLLTTDYER